MMNIALNIQHRKPDLLNYKLELIFVMIVHTYIYGKRSVKFISQTRETVHGTPISRVPDIPGIFIAGWTSLDDRPWALFASVCMAVGQAAGPVDSTYDIAVSRTVADSHMGSHPCTVLLSALVACVTIGGVSLHAAVASWQGRGNFPSPKF